MDKLKVWFGDFWPEWNDEDFITPIISKHFEIVLDRNNPDVMFHSVFGGMQESSQFHGKKILFLGENKRPQDYHSTYSISFDAHTNTNYRLPLWQVYILKKPELKARLYNRLNYTEDQFVRWCSFTVSNPVNVMRVAAYHGLTQYKKVSSYGKVLTNDFTLINYSNGKYWRDAKDAFFLKNPHKFMLVYENTQYPYYCTEKLMDAFLVGSLPIYLGSPTVHKEFNEKSFINVLKMGQEKAFQLVKDMDKDNNLFLSMYKEPIFTEDQKNELDNNLNNFEEWLINKIK